MGMAHSSPPARDGQEDLGRLLHKRRLLLQRKRQVSVTGRLRGERSKSCASYAEGRQSSVLNLFYAVQAQRNPSKVCGSHRATGMPHPYLTSLEAQRQLPPNRASI